MRDYGYNEDEPNPSNLYSSVLELFDAVHVTFTSPPQGDWHQRDPFPLELELEGWRRIETWVWSDVAVVASSYFGSPYISDLEFLQNLSNASLSIIFDLRKIPAHKGYLEQACVAEVAGDDGAEFSILSCPQIKEVVFQVLSQEKKSRISGRVRNLLLGSTQDAEETKRMLGLIRFEVDE